MTTLLEQIKAEIESRKNRSAWGRGVNEYALELIENLEEHENYTGCNYCTLDEIKADLLNGASDWAAYSWGGCSLIYNSDICERLATPSEQKRTDGGRLRPNNREEWLDTQARALYQAANRICATARKLEDISNND